MVEMMVLMMVLVVLAMRAMMIVMMVVVMSVHKVLVLMKSGGCWSIGEVVTMQIRMMAKVMAVVTMLVDQKKWWQ